MPAEHSFPEDKSPRAIIIAVAVVAAVLIGGVFYVLMRKSMRDSPPLRLDNAIRAGSPDFEKYKKLIALDDPEADESPRALGDIVMTLHTTARNFTGRTIVGLEVHAAVVDHQNQPVKERTVVVLPNSERGELEPNKTMFVGVRLEGMTESDDRANIKMEVTAFRFK
ncbi:MAG TPA: hypothetical protein VLQ90_05620 [Pyrinomonadaceae bacterium]|nr:hypothetical protein [Pyrinomonadaceae bacterium]